MHQVAFIWHMHQPCYKDFFSGRSLLPWVRLHTAKDYTGMAMLLEEFPAIRATVNFVPSLLMQVADGADDFYLDLTRRHVPSLLAQEREFIIRNFFHAPLETTIKKFPRYFELHEKRFESRRIDDQDLLDLEVLANLAWIHPCVVDRDSELKRLAPKGSRFSSADRDLILSRQTKLMRELVPRWKRLADRVELTVSPFYHPILPLLTDFSSQDADTQVRSALEFAQGAFAERPVGMWLPELGISDSALRLAQSAGVRWVVADEDILRRSTETPSLEPHRVGDVAVLFRDKDLSNRIGFEYKNLDAEAAAKDMVRAIRERPPGLVVIALDGENPWEHYRDGGVQFLRHLYRQLDVNSIETVTPREYLKKNPPRRTLKHIEPGSWINSDFSVWSGHAEDVRAWELLRETRDACGPSESLLAAEGSDWFWWFGPEFHSNQDIEFDLLFRRHLAAAYRLHGKPVPATLDVPIKSIDPARVYGAPRSELAIRLDGEVSSFLEWSGAGRFDVVREHDLFVSELNPVTEIHFGTDRDSLYVRLDLRGPLPRPRLLFRRPNIPWPRIQPHVKMMAKAIIEMACPLSALGVETGDTIEFQIELDTPRGPLRLPTIMPLSLIVGASNPEWEA